MYCYRRHFVSKVILLEVFPTGNILTEKNFDVDYKRSENVSTENPIVGVRKLRTQIAGVRIEKPWAP